MKKEIVLELTESFEGHAQTTDNGIEFWLARDLQFLLGYERWENFINAVNRARTACDISGHDVIDHFREVTKMVEIGSGVQREVADVMLTRYACYLIAQNGDPKKREVAFAQTYFAIQTRRAELIEQRLLETERLFARKKLTQTEKVLSSVIFQQTGTDGNFALIRSKGDQALFGKSTQAMKAIWNVPVSRPLADFAPTIVLRAKDFAAEITVHNSREHKMSAEQQISDEHAANYEAVRKTLMARGIRPEALPAAEDVKKLERRVAAQDRKTLGSPDGL